MAKIDYNAWALRILERKNRAVTLKWKADELASLVDERTVFPSALEIGCAEGQVIHHIQERFHIKRCYGTDIAEGFLSLARKRYPEITFLHTTGTELPFPNRSIDLIVLSDLLEHVEDIHAILSEVKRVGSFLLVKAPIEKYLWRSIVSKPLGRSPRVGPGHPDGHLHEFTKRGWLALLRRAGFSVIKSKVIYFDSADGESATGRNPLVGFRWFLDRALKRVLPGAAHIGFGGHLVVYCGSGPETVL